jgi:hypothetical protein
VDHEHGQLFGPPSASEPREALSHPASSSPRRPVAPGGRLCSPDCRARTSYRTATSSLSSESVVWRGRGTGWVDAHLWAGERPDVASQIVVGRQSAFGGGGTLRGVPARVGLTFWPAARAGCPDPPIFSAFLGAAGPQRRGGRQFLERGTRLRRLEPYHQEPLWGFGGSGIARGGGAPRNPRRSDAASRAPFSLPSY